MNSTAPLQATFDDAPSIKRAGALPAFEGRNKNDQGEHPVTSGGLRAWRGYGWAAVAVTGAFLLRLAFDPLWGNRLGFAWFFMAVLVMTRWRGIGPQIATIVAGFLLADWFFVQPRHSLLISLQADQVNAIIYLGITATIVLFSARARRAVASELAARDEIVNILQREQAERDRLIAQLQAAVAEIKTLTGLLPICSHCKRIREDDGSWYQIEVYIRDRSNATFTHGICPDCSRQHFGVVEPGANDRSKCHHCG